MNAKSSYDIAVIEGDGIGPEVCSAAVDVLRAAFGKRPRLSFNHFEAGAGCYQRNGDAFPDETFEG